MPALVYKATNYLQCKRLARQARVVEDQGDLVEEGDISRPMDPLVQNLPTGHPSLLSSIVWCVRGRSKDSQVSRGLSKLRAKRYQLREIERALFRTN